MIRLPEHHEVTLVAERLGVDADMNSVLELTSITFVGDVLTAVVDDPKLSEDSKIAIRVSTRGTVDEIMERERRWYDGMETLVGERTAAFYLAIDASE